LAESSTRFRQSVFSWINLEATDVLYLEGAEDFDVVGPDQATAVQVRRTTAPITLGSAKIIKVLGQFWKLREGNRTKRVAFQYLTTSEPGFELGSPFGTGVRGIDFWERCKRHPEGVESIRAFLLKRDDLDKDLRLFLENATLDQVYDDLVQPIAWITGGRDTHDLQNAISDILIVHGEQYGVLPSAAEAVRPRLLQEVCDTITRSRIEDRVLTRSDFLTIFEQATSVSVPRSQIDLLQVTVAGLVQSYGLVAEEISFTQGPIPTTSAPNLPSGVFERTDLIEAVKANLQRSDLYLLSGSAGIGKTTIAACVARSWQAQTFWINLRGLPPESVSLGLRRLAATISHNTDKCLIVLDDIDLLPTRIEGFEPQLASLLLVTKEKGVPVLLTSQRVFSQRLARRFNTSALSSLRVPPMSLREIHDYCAQEGCPVSGVGLVAIQILAQTSGHPTLVHACIINLIKRGWRELPDSHAVNNLDALDNERAEARQLLSDLPETNRELLYRLSLIEDRFRKDHALRIGELEQSITHPGDCFDQIVGPWIEPLASDYFQTSELLNGEAEQVWSQDKCSKFHKAIAEAILASEPRTTIEANTILRHAWKARSAKHLYGICLSLTGANTEIVHSAFGAMVWFAAISLAPGEILFSEDPPLSGMLRSFQYRIARQAHERLGETVLTAWIAETEKRETNLIERFLLSMNLTMFSSAILASSRLFSSLQAIQEIENAHQDLIGDLERRVELAPSEGHAWNTTSVFENAVLSALSRYKDIQQFEDLVDSLRTAQDPLRTRILGALAKSPTSSTLLVDRIWLSEADKASPDWQRCLVAFNQALSSFAVWNQPMLVDASIRGIIVITDEYLGQTARALEELNRLTAEYRRDSGLLRTARVTVLSNLGRLHEVAGVARDSISLWETELDSLHIHDVLTLRSAAIAASKMREWTNAVEFFDHAYSFAMKKQGYRAIAIGLRADAAFASWNAGKTVECIQRFSAALKDVEEFALENANRSDAFRLRKFIGMCLLWILHQYETKWDKGVSEPPPGVCSQLETVKELYRLPDSQPDMLWWMLTQIDYHLNSTGEVEQAIGQRLMESSFAPVRPMFIRQKIQRLLRSGRTADLPEQLTQYTRACLEVGSSNTLAAPELGPVPTIDLSKGILADDAVVGTPLFVTALLRIAGSGELILSTFAAWHQFCSTHAGFEKLTVWMNSAQQQLVLDASTCERIIFNSAADLWSERVPAAINLARIGNVSAGQLWVAQLAIVQFLNAVPWLDDIGSAVAEFFAGGWKRQFGFRGQFSMPNLTVPELERACNLPDGDSLAKVSQIINAASRAVNRSLANSLQELVNQLALRRHM
jgi:tetratricopeptide (TPR) repeat protein